RADNCSADKDRLNFARVLIATSDLEIVNTVESVMVDGNLVEIKIVEEWGYALGEDTCLFEDESDSEASQSDHEEGQSDQEAGNNVEALVENFVEGMKEDDDFGSQDNFQLSNSRAVDEARNGEEEVVVPFQDGEVTVTPTVLVTDHIAGNDDPTSGVGDSPKLPGAQGSPSFCSSAAGLRPPVASGGKKGSSLSSGRRKRTKSCPPGVKRSMISGPWSLDWLHDHNHGDVGVIFSTKKRPRKEGQSGGRQKKEGQEHPKRRKAGGIMRHSLYNLKKVARLPSKD
ncbi:DUF4283 domain protein, partial [Trifolium medium]|nr:DUF4283 domain protein [Trifolium medium]